MPNLEVVGGIDFPAWKDAKEYRPFILHKGRYWWIYLNREQRDIGKAYAWLMSRHEVNHAFYDLTYDEWYELKDLMRLYERTIRVLWPLGSMSYLWDGFGDQQYEGHACVHLIPCYIENGYTPIIPMDQPDEVVRWIHARIGKEISYLAGKP